MTELEVIRAMRRSPSQQAMAWAEIIRIACRMDIKSPVHDYHPHLSSVVMDVEALRLAFLTVCNRYDVDPDVVLSACRDVVQDRGPTQ
jgi:hypothetical protein